MIVRWDGPAMLADRAWLAAFFGLSPETIRKRMTPCACDPRTRAALYLVDEDELERMRTRRRRVA